MKILVVDDDATQRLLMKNYLNLEGWDVAVAENGEAALEEMARDKVDFVISDVYMPVMDGLKLHRTVRDVPGYETLPFLFVSAYDDQHTTEAVKNPKIEGFLKKAKLIDELKKWVLYLSAPEENRPPFPPGKKFSF